MVVKHAPVFFSTENKVGKEDSHGGGGQTHNTRCQCQEPESVIRSGSEKTRHDEVELYKSSACGKGLARRVILSIRALTEGQNAAEKGSSLHIVSIAYEKNNKWTYPRPKVLRSRRDLARDLVDSDGIRDPLCCMLNYACKY